MPNKSRGGDASPFLNAALEKGPLSVADKTTVFPFGIKSDFRGYPEWEKKDFDSPTFSEVIKKICDDVGKNTTHGEDENCKDFMLPYERNTEPYRYDKMSPLYTPQFLDLSDAPTSP